MMNNVNRRQFVQMLGTASAAMCLSPRFAFAGLPVSDRKIRVGIVGGQFGTSFYFNEHPNCIVEAVSDLIPDRRERLMKTYKCSKSYESLDLLLKDPKIEAVGLFTPAPDHAKHTLQCLNAGKHVLCAVPLALTLEDCKDILDAVKRTGLTFMMAETSTYRQEVISARKFYRDGDFGNIFSSGAQYYHPGLEELFFTRDGKPTWRHGIPPMLYPTHVTSFLISVTGERLASVSCIGWGDNSHFLKNNSYNNPFWNEIGFFRTNKGNTFIGEVCWRGALVGTERGEWRGDKMSFYSEYKGLDLHKVIASEKRGVDEGGFSVAKPEMKIYEQELWYKTAMLPPSMQHESGHGDSHCFITNEFLNAIVQDRQPEVNIYEAIAYTLPGIVAHESALKNGEILTIPIFY